MFRCWEVYLKIEGFPKEIECVGFRTAVSDV